MKYTWKFTTGGTTWTFEDTAIPDSFSGIMLRHNISGSGLISSNEAIFSISDPEGALIDTDFDGDEILIELVEATSVIRSWKMKIKRTTASYQQIKFHCVDVLQEVIAGDFPNTGLLRELYPSNDAESSDNHCIPITLGTAYIPLQSVNTGSERYYLLGDSGPTYDVLEVSSPHDWSNHSTWEKASYTMTIGVEDDYASLQPLIHDVNGDGSLMAPGLWRNGDSFLEMPTQFTRSDTIGKTGPDEWISYVLQAMGVASTDIDVSNYSNNFNLEFNGGWWEKESRENVLSSLLTQCDCFFTFSTKIELRPFSKNSVETFTNVLKGTFRSSVLTRSTLNGGTVKWAGENDPQDKLPGAYPVRLNGVYTASPVSDPDAPFEASFINSSTNAQRVAILYYQKKLGQINRVSFSVAGPSITNLATLSPGMVVTVDDVNYGGSKKYIITGMNIGKDLIVKFDAVELANLNDMDDLSPNAQSITSADFSDGQFLPVGPVPLIGIKKNTVSFDTTSNMKAYIHGFDNNGIAKDIYGKIIYDGEVLPIPSTESSTTWTIDTSQEAEGYIVLDTALAEKFTVSGDTHSIVFAKLFSGVWSYDNGSGWTEWTPSVTDMLIGTMSVGSTAINSANVWPYARELSTAVDSGMPSGVSDAIEDELDAATEAAIDAIERIYDIAFMWNGLLTDSLVLVRVEMVRAVIYPVGLTLSRLSSTIAATGSSVFSLKKNDVEFGTMTFAASGTTATVASSSGASFAVGDILTIVAPTTADATLANLYGTLAGSTNIEIINDLGTLTGGTEDIDLEDGTVVTATISTATQTFTFSGAPNSGNNGSFTLFLTNGNSQTVNWPASVDWPNGVVPTLTTSGLDVLVFTTNDSGTTWYGFVAGRDLS